MVVCPQCGNEIVEGSTVCDNCGTTYGLDEAMETVTDQLIAGAFAMMAQHGRTEIGALIGDVDAVNWNAIAIETMLFFQFVIGVYAAGLFDNETSKQILNRLEPTLVDKFAKAGSVSAANIGAFREMYSHNLQLRHPEYSSFELEKTIREEIEMQADGTVLNDFERKERFASVFLSEADIRKASTEEMESLQTSPIWQFGNRIAGMLGEPQSTKIIAYVHRYTIAFLFLIFNPVKQLTNIKKFLDADGPV